MKNIIIEHVKKYPLMEIRDLAKLIFQSEFGGGHMIADSRQSLQRIQEEYDSLSLEALDVSSVVEPIGNGMARIYLSCLQKELSPEILNKMFVHSANNKKGTLEGLKEKMNLVLSLCQDRVLSYSCKEVEKFFENWEKDGFPAISHSTAYRQAYQPAYRVIEENFVKLYHTICCIQNAHPFDSETFVSNPYVVSIDGMSGSGKSTFASLLYEAFPSSNLFHTDDYFLRPAQRSAERLSEIGGNVDYERFYEEIIRHLNNKDGLFYQKYDCQTQTLDETIFVPWRPLVIIEGSYSQHPYFGDAYDLRVFLTISPEEQCERIRKRNGEFLLKRFVSEWIPKENEYFKHFMIQKKAAI